MNCQHQKTDKRCNSLFSYDGVVGMPVLDHQIYKWDLINERSVNVRKKIRLGKLPLAHIRTLPCSYHLWQLALCVFVLMNKKDNKAITCFKLKKCTKRKRRQT